MSDRKIKKGNNRMLVKPKAINNLGMNGLRGLIKHQLL